MAGPAPGGYGGGHQGYSSSYSASGSYTSSIWGSQAAQAPILPARPPPLPPGPNRYGGAPGQPPPPGTEPGRLQARGPSTYNTGQPCGPARQARPSFKLRRSIQARPTLSILNELSGGARPDWEYLDVPLVERERRAWQADMPVEEVGMFECKCTVGELEFIAEGHTKPEARAAVAELAVQGLITQRCELNDTEGVGSSEDNCPWAAIASLALHKLYTDWQAQGFSLPPSLTNTPCDGSLSGLRGDGSLSVTEGGPREDGGKNPLQQLNEMASRMKLALDFELTGEVGAPNDKVFTMAVSLAGHSYAGQGKNKKTARHAAASLALASQEEWYVPPAPIEEEEEQEQQEEEEEEPAAKKPSLPGSYPSV